MFLQFFDDFLEGCDSFGNDLLDHFHNLSKLDSEFFGHLFNVIARLLRWKDSLSILLILSYSGGKKFVMVSYNFVS